MRFVVVISVLLVTSLVKADGLWNEIENILEDYDNFVNGTGTNHYSFELCDFSSSFISYHFLW